MTLDETLALHLKTHHTGEPRAATSRELEQMFSLRNREIRRIVNRLRVDGVPICSSDYGYFYAETADELHRTISQLRSRIRNISEAERGLMKALQHYNGQQLSITAFEEGDDP